MEERVSLLEAKLDEHSRGLAEVRQTVVHLELRMERRFDGVDRAINRLVAIQLASMTARLAALAGIILQQ